MTGEPLIVEQSEAEERQRCTNWRAEGYWSGNSNETFELQLMGNYRDVTGSRAGMFTVGA